jgi:DNA-binding SARP family transcriptional activator
MPADSKASRLGFGCHAETPPLRVYLAGDVAIEAHGRLLPGPALPGPQGRHLLALLAAEHDRAVGHDEIVDELWDDSPPPAWPASLKALVSHIRGALAGIELDGSRLLVGAPGVYRFRLPDHAWVDLDAATSAAHRAEALLAAGRLDDALREAFVARLITSRPLLPGQNGPWLDRSRRRLADLRIRALECSARSRIATGATAQAIRDAELAVQVAPLREPGWRLLMDAYVAAGDTASALQAFARCQVTLREALGVGPSGATRDRHSALLAQAG